MKVRTSLAELIIFQFTALLFMAFLVPMEARKQPSKRKKKQPNPSPPSSSSSSWDQIKNILSCKQIPDSKVQDPAAAASSTVYKLGSSCSSICSFNDVVRGNTSRVGHRADNSPEGSSLGQESRVLTKKISSHGNGSSSRSAYHSSHSVKTTCNMGSSRGMQLRKLSGCYECHAIVDPSRYPLPRTTICACSECGEVFPKIESLEHHQMVKHAVSELGPEDSSRNIVEIIFKSSWLKKDNPICKIERILKVHNTRRTIQRFEDYRDAVKLRANNAAAKKNARCAADGNELLRFHCTTLNCSLGSRGSSSLCGFLPGCGVCTVIRHGFQCNKVSGVRTMASSGRAHDCLAGKDSRRAMLVCRVIAGRVKQPATDVGKPAEEEDGAGLLSGGSYDSVAGYGGVYSNLEELYVFNPRAILPCFVVIYKALES